MIALCYLYRFSQAWGRCFAVRRYDRDRLIRWLRDSARWRLALSYDAVEAPPS